MRLSWCLGALLLAFVPFLACVPANERSLVRPLRMRALPRWIDARGVWRDARRETESASLHESEAIARAVDGDRELLAGEERCLEEDEGGESLESADAVADGSLDFGDGAEVDGDLALDKEEDVALELCFDRELGGETTLAELEDPPGGSGLTFSVTGTLERFRTLAPEHSYGGWELESLTPDGVLADPELGEEPPAEGIEEAEESDLALATELEEAPTWEPLEPDEIDGLEEEEREDRSRRAATLRAEIEAWSPWLRARSGAARRSSPAEFSRQGALLLGCAELARVAPTLLAQIVEGTCGRVPIIALVGDEENQNQVRDILKERGLSPSAVTFMVIPHDTMWVRDYGPILDQLGDGTPLVLDAGYSDEREQDDSVPVDVAYLLHAQRVPVPLEIDGGNLQSNGDGLCVTTLRLVEDNDTTEEEVREVLTVFYGCEEVVFLEPLAGEETGHVDMFTVFTSPTTVVVGEYSASNDPVNAARLDRNAERLANVRTRRGPLRVVRIPMPPHDGEDWPSYTNVIFANGRLLVPVFPAVDDEGRKQALGVFEYLLPGWSIVPIDSSEISRLGGGLHCVSRNLPAIGRLRDLSPGECK